MEETLKQIKKLGVGKHYCGWFKGYIEISKCNENYTVLWTSGKNSHNYHDSRRAVLIQFKESEICNIFQSTISMHPVYDEQEKQYCINFIKNKVKKAFERRPFFSDINISFFILLVFIVFSFQACHYGNNIKNTESFTKYDIIIIDGCEYIQYGTFDGYLNITHKGNCKNHPFKFRIKDLHLQ